jgi:prepilin-type N-terminal cleavage/methylation domain-containing protein
MVQHSNRLAGFSLLELVVAVAIFLIVTGAIYQLLNVARSDQFTANQKVEAMQNARMGMNAIGRDAINAGVGYAPTGANLPDNALTLLGLPADTDNQLDRLTPVIGGDDLNENEFNPDGDNSDQITFVYADDGFNGGQPLPISTIVPSGSQLRINTAGPDGVIGTDDDYDNSVCAIGDLYVISTSTGQAIGQVTELPEDDKIDFANGDPLGLNKPGANGPIASIRPGPAGLSRISWVTYLVTIDGVLVRRVYGNPANIAGVGVPASDEDRWLDEPLATGVLDFQCEYVLRDGRVVTDPTASERMDIRQVRVTLRVRSPKIDPRTGLAQEVTLVSTFCTRNLGYSGRI